MTILIFEEKKSHLLPCSLVHLHSYFLLILTAVASLSKYLVMMMMMMMHKEKKSSKPQIDHDGHHITISIT